MISDLHSGLLGYEKNAYNNMTNFVLNDIEELKYFLVMKISYGIEEFVLAKINHSNF